MATITAAQTGDWSDTSTWTGGVLPGADDTARIDNDYVVTIDQDITVVALETTTNAPAGYFTITASRNCTVGALIAGGECANGVVYIDATGAAVTWHGDIAADARVGIVVVALDTLTIVGDVHGSDSTAYIAGVSAGLTLHLSVTGAVRGGNAIGAKGVMSLPEGAATVVVVGTITGGSGEGSNGAQLVVSSGSLTITGDVTGGSASSSYGALIGYAEDSCTIAGTLTAGTAHYTPAVAVYTVNGPFLLDGNLNFSATGESPVWGSLLFTTGGSVTVLDETETLVQVGATMQQVLDAIADVPTVAEFEARTIAETAADRWEALLDATPTGAVVDDNDPDPTATAFETNLTLASDSINDAFCVFTAGALLGQSQKISDFDSATKVLTVTKPFTAAPAAGDNFLIVGKSA